MSSLHEFDIALCGYVRGNLGQIGDAESRQELEGDLDDRLLDWFADDEIDAEEFDTGLLLSWQELYELEEASRLLPGRLEWTSYVPLHRRHVRTLAEVRDGLTRETTEQWSRICVEYGQRLEARRLPLHVGIEIVQDWTSNLRELLRGLGRMDLLPVPVGMCPTPTNPSPLPKVLQTGLHPTTDSGEQTTACQKREPASGASMGPGQAEKKPPAYLGVVLDCDQRTIRREGSSEGVCLASRPILWHTFVTFYKGGEAGVSPDQWKNGYIGEWSARHQVVHDLRQVIASLGLTIPHRKRRVAAASDISDDF